MSIVEDFLTQSEVKVNQGNLNAGTNHDADTETIQLAPCDDWSIVVFGRSKQAVAINLPRENRKAILRAAIKALRGQLKNA